MPVKFEIEAVFKARSRGIFIAAVLLDEDTSFSLSDNSYLGTCSIINWLDIPRAIDKNGKQRLNVFIFQLKNENDKEKLKKGQIVELTT